MSDDATRATDDDVAAENGTWQEGDFTIEPPESGNIKNSPLSASVDVNDGGDNGAVERSQGG